MSQPNITVLAVDDSQDILFALSAICELEGWRTPVSYTHLGVPHTRQDRRGREQEGRGPSTRTGPPVPRLWGGRRGLISSRSSESQKAAIEEVCYLGSGHGMRRQEISAHLEMPAGIRP